MRERETQTMKEKVISTMMVTDWMMDLMIQTKMATKTLKEMD